ncbi:hypothetical protein GDO81_013696 [Engystomops pustulosus]|uniref:Uncharacterized protein n=1 Tax=Engystomops pustulosus TaxID=76066 RepID=A0AAV7B4W9_ENGPU|nr:hypothetical protein GDO81_013696 [Engystomops pustulosus]
MRVRHKFLPMRHFFVSSASSARHFRSRTHRDRIITGQSTAHKSCIFIWRLSSEMTINMRQRLAEMRQRGKVGEKNTPHKTTNTRRETIAVMCPAPVLSSDSDKDGVDEGSDEDMTGSEKNNDLANSFGRSASFWEMKRVSHTPEEVA